MKLHENLNALGNSAVNKPLYDKPGADKTVLEKFPNPHMVMNGIGALGLVNIRAPEFTSLCPLTGAPDFATIVIDYVPKQWNVESKALKLYLYSFRNEGEFHESVICRICNDLVELLDPTWIRVKGEFTPRGGIPFWPTAIYGSLPEAFKQEV
jgi:7-cyano-7-deazaguanine reductase